MGTTDNPEAVKLVGYKITRPDCGGWMFAGTTAAEVAKTLKNETEMSDDLPADEFGGIHIEAFETTQEEIDNMPEFPGW